MSYKYKFYGRKENPETRTISFPVGCDEEEEILEISAVWEICYHCNGDGKHSRHLGAFTQEDMDQMDYEFMDDYRRGFYDKTCEECKGSGKVLVADERDSNYSKYIKYCEDMVESQRADVSEYNYFYRGRD